VPLETLEKVLPLAEEAVVIIITTFTDPLDLGVKAVKMGAQDYLIEGEFDSKVLNFSIRYALERYKLNKQLKGHRQEVEVAQRRLQALQQLTGTGYWELHADGKTMHWSAAAARLLGKEQSPAHPRLPDWLRCVHPEDAGRIEQCFQQAVKDKTPFQTTFRLKAATGHARLACRADIRDADKNHFHIIGLLRPMAD